MEPVGGLLDEEVYRSGSRDEPFVPGKPVGMVAVKLSSGTKG